MDFNDYVNKGIACIQKKEYGPALENLKAALNLKPDNQEIQNIIKMAEGIANAEAQASQSLANEAKQRAASMGITDVDKAIAEYTETLTCNPNDASVKSALSIAYYIRGLTSSSKGEHAKAIADYNDAIKHEPNFPHAINKRGQAHLDNGDFDKAIVDFEELIRLDPNYNMAKDKLADAYCDRGMAYDRKGDYASAIPDFKKSLEFKPDDKTVRELLERAEAKLAKH